MKSLVYMGKSFVNTALLLAIVHDVGFAGVLRDPGVQDMGNCDCAREIETLTSSGCSVREQ